MRDQSNPHEIGHCMCLLADMMVYEGRGRTIKPLTKVIAPEMWGILNIGSAWETILGGTKNPLDALASPELYQNGKCQRLTDGSDAFCAILTDVLTFPLSPGYDLLGAAEATTQGSGAERSQSKNTTEIDSAQWPMIALASSAFLSEEGGGENILAHTALPDWATGTCQSHFWVAALCPSPVS